MAIIAADTISAKPTSTVLVWDNITENDTVEPIITDGKTKLVTIAITGSFGGATVRFQGSLDGFNYFDFQSGGSDIAVTSDAAYDLATAMVYLRPSFTGGTSQNIKVAVSYKG